MVFPATVAAVATVPAPTVFEAGIVQQLETLVVGVASVSAELDVRQPSHSYVTGHGSFYPAPNRRRVRGSRQTTGGRIA